MTREEEFKVYAQAVDDFYDSVSDDIAHGWLEDTDVANEVDANLRDTAAYLKDRFSGHVPGVE